MVSVVIINGLGGSGKSTFCQECVKAGSEREDLVVAELSTVDFVKGIAQQCGWDGGKTQEDRIFLSDMKNAMTKWRNLPIRKVFDRIEEIVDQEKDYLFFVNSREPEDHAEIRRMARANGYNVIAIKINNPNIESNEVPELVEGINSCKYEMEINNDGSLEDLRKKARVFVEMNGGLYDLFR